MKGRQAKKRWIEKSLVLSMLACLFLLACAFAFHNSDHATEPYQLKYPPNFGGRFIIPADNPTTRQGVALGRMLFYEELLSANNKISCASCHQQTRAFTDGRQFSVGVDGSLTKRNAMSLTNLLWVRSLFWDGRAASLEAQAVVPLTDPHEMGQSLETRLPTQSYEALTCSLPVPGRPVT